jgi:hypothetical protein
MNYWLRWLGVLPGALAGGFLVNFLGRRLIVATVNAIDSFITLPAESVPDLERLLLPFFAPFAAVWAGARIAPEHKVATALGLAVLFEAVLFLVPALSGGRVELIMPGAIVSLVAVATAIFVIQRGSSTAPER